MLAAGFSAFGQKDSLPPPPYLRFPGVPPLQLLLGDSTTIYTKADLRKKKPVVLMVFSPDCSHCQHQAEQIRDNSKALEGIQLVLATMDPLWKMNQFVERYQLRGLSNITVGRDIAYLLQAFYDFHSLPFHALYNKKAELVQVVEGSMTIEKIIELTTKG